MYDKGIVVKFADAQLAASIEKIVHYWREKVFTELKQKSSQSISLYGCRDQSKPTLDEFTNASKIETRNRIIEILRNLGDLSGYFASGRKFGALIASSTQSEICQATLEFKKESDKIESELEEFAKIYVLDVPPEYADPDKPARTVEFDNPEITKRAEKTLEFRIKLFLPKKDDIKNISGKYGCK